MDKLSLLQASTPLKEFADTRGNKSLLSRHIGVTSDAVVKMAKNAKRDIYVALGPDSRLVAIEVTVLGSAEY